MMGGQRTLETFQNKPPAGHPKNSKKTVDFERARVEKGPGNAVSWAVQGSFFVGRRLDLPPQGGQTLSEGLEGLSHHHRHAHRHAPCWLGLWRFTGLFWWIFTPDHSRLLPAGATGNPHDRRHARIHDLCDDPWDPCHARTLWIPVPAWIQQGAHPSESQPGIPKHPLIAACFRQSTRPHPPNIVVLNPPQTCYGECSGTENQRSLGQPPPTLHSRIHVELNTRLESRR